MKQSKKKLPGAAICLLALSAAKAQDPVTTVFPEPADYCFPQTVLHREYAGTGFYIDLTHHVLVQNEDASAGDIFVGARFRNRPNELWLLSGNTWRNAANTTVGWPLVYVRYDDRLPPVVRVSLHYDPAAISSFGDGEIWVGYGFRTQRTPTQQAFQESFDEMMRKRRFSLLWEIKPGQEPFHGAMRVEDANICLEATGMTRTVIRGGIRIVGQ